MSEASEFLGDPSWSKAKLLEAIRAGTRAGAQSQSRTSVYALVPISALLIKVSDESAIQAAQAEKTSRRLVNLTVALLTLTAALLGVTIIQLFRSNGV